MIITELRLVCYLTESIWTPRSKSNMRHQKPTHGHVDQRVVLHGMNGTIFFYCWTSWISRCFPAAIFFQTESRVSCSRELRKARLKKVRQWRKPRPMKLVSRNLLSTKKTPPQNSSASSSLVIQEFDQSFVTSGARKLVRNNNQYPTTETQQHILNSGDKMTLHLRGPGNRCGVVNLQAQQAPGNWCEVKIIKSKGQGWNSTTCKSPTIDTPNRSSRTCGKSWISQKRHQCSTWRPMYWSGNYICWQRRMPLFILDQVTKKNWKYTATQTSRSSRTCSISLRDWYWNIKPKFWKYHRLIGQLPSLTRSTLTYDQEIKWVKTKVHVYWDSVLCLWKMQEHSEANQRWKDQLEEFRHSNSCRELFGIDGESVEFEWNMFPGLTWLEILRKIQKDLPDQNIEPENFEGRIIFMSMFNDIEWTMRGNSGKCISNSEQVKNYVKRFSRGHGHSQTQPTNKNDTELSATHLKENGIPLPQKWWDISKRLDTQYSRASVLWVVKFWKRKGGRWTMHFNADSSNTELLFRTIHSAN